MIDIARLREDPEAVRENIKKKFQDHKLPLVDEALELDKQYRAAITRASELRSMRNKLSKEIGQFMREGKKEEAAENKKKVGEMAEELKSLEEVEKESGDKLREVMMKIPNFLDPTVPIGKDDSENVEITKYGDPVVPDYEVPYHTDIMESFDGIDLDAAGRVAGMIKSSYDTLLQEGEYTIEEKHLKKKTDSFSGVYWCLIVAIYLGWSFWTNNWKFTWIIWPVAGVLYAAVPGIVKMTIEGREK